MLFFYPNWCGCRDFLFKFGDSKENDMVKNLQQRLNDTIGQRPDWFWEWVEINHQDEEALLRWFREAPRDQMIVFWQQYFDEVLGRLIADYDGFFLSEEAAALHLTEDDMADFNNWVIVQGQALWTAVIALTERLEHQPNATDEANLRELFQIFKATTADHEEGLSATPRTWAGIQWTPRWGYFPGDTADFIFEERFGETLWEQTD
jgi:hypothetical protein